MGYTIGAAANPDVTSLAGTEVFVCLQTTVKDCTAAVIAAYTVDTLMAASTATPTTGDYLVAERSGAEKRLGLGAVVQKPVLKRELAAAVAAALAGKGGGA